jgi:hypothetical protein
MESCCERDVAAGWMNLRAPPPKAVAAIYPIRGMRATGAIVLSRE